MKFNSTALLRSTTWVIWFIVAITLFSELSAPFKALLTALAGHHWIGKSIVSTIAFALLYLFFSRTDESEDVLKGAWYVAGSAVLGGLIIFSFFLWHFLKG